MPFFLKERDTQSEERMDKPDCARDKLFNTYRNFSAVNQAISGWGRIYEHKIKPFLEAEKQSSLLDIGFGGGDIPIKIARRAINDELALKITAIETDPRAMEYIKTLDAPANIDFKLCSSTNLVEAGDCFDFVISNHLLHHLAHKEIHKLLNEAKTLSKKNVLFNDIERCDLSYAAFNVLSRPFFKNSFITEDGLTSIKRSYTYKELRNLAPEKWTLESLFPSRLLLSYNH